MGGCDIEFAGDHRRGQTPPSNFSSQGRQGERPPWEENGDRFAQRHWFVIEPLCLVGPNADARRKIDDHRGEMKKAALF